MTFILFLFIVSSITWVLAYFALLWPAVLSPFLLLFGSSIAADSLASSIAIVAFAFQLLLLIILFLVRNGRKKLQRKLHDQASKNLVLNERANNISSQLKKQESELKQTLTAAQQVPLLEERARNLQLLVDELKARNEELSRSSAVLQKELAQLKSGKPKGVVATVGDWLGKILP